MNEGVYEANYADFNMRHMTHLIKYAAEATAAISAISNTISSSKGGSVKFNTPIGKVQITIEGKHHRHHHHNKHE